MAGIYGTGSTLFSVRKSSSPLAIQHAAPPSRVHADRLAHCLVRPLEPSKVHAEDDWPPCPETKKGRLAPPPIHTPGTAACPSRDCRPEQRRARLSGKRIPWRESCFHPRRRHAAPVGWTSTRRTSNNAMNDLRAWDVFAPMSGFGPRPHWPQWQVWAQSGQSTPRLAVDALERGRAPRSALSSKQRGVVGRIGE
jgi:hypothetical protein